MSERFRLLRKGFFDWLTGKPPTLHFHNGAEHWGRCPGHLKRKFDYRKCPHE